MTPSEVRNVILADIPKLPEIAKVCLSDWIYRSQTIAVDNEFIYDNNNKITSYMLFSEDGNRWFLKYLYISMGNDRKKDSARMISALCAKHKIKEVFSIFPHADNYSINADKSIGFGTIDVDAGLCLLKYTNPTDVEEIRDPISSDLKISHLLRKHV